MLKQEYRDLLNQVYFDNTLKQYLACLAILLLGVLLKRLIAVLISKQTFRFFSSISHNQYSEEFVQLFRKPFEQLITILFIYWAFVRLTFPKEWDIDPIDKFGLRWLIEAIYEIIVIVIITRLALRVADFIAFVFNENDQEQYNKDLVRFVKEFAKIVIVVISIFVVLGMAFEVNILTLVTSLGIGGLAVALAAQDTIANLFGSFIIYLDKPFKSGDQIECGEISGVVEKIGFRTTRIRTHDRSLLTVPNKKLVDTALNNISQIEHRRVKFVLPISFQSKTGEIPSLLRDIENIISKHPETTEEIIVRLVDFDNSSMNILVVYFVTQPDFESMVKVKENINLQIIAAVEKHGCRFASSAQTVFIEAPHGG